MDRTVLLDVDGLAKSFGSNQVLKACSFQGREGTVTALMGRNGAGKSTMLRIAVGRVRPDRGRVRFKGQLAKRPSLALLARRGLFYSPQDPALTALLSVGGHLESMAQVYAGAERLAGAVDQLGLQEFLERTPPTLSGGERKRASLAMAIVRAPSCLIMDEPFVGMAPKDRGFVFDAFRTLREQGCAIVISGHDVEDVFEVADEIVWVVAGTSQVIGSPEAARTHDRFRREYLGR
jgi:ABC-type multidrug transport system ATPase subunit